MKGIDLSGFEFKGRTLQLNVYFLEGEGGRQEERRV